MEKKSVAVKKEDVKQVVSIFDDLRDEVDFDFRMTLDGELTKGHWEIRSKGIPSGPGFKFRLKKTRGLYYIKNLDYGYQKTVDLEDERGMVYDTVTTNAQGYDFENQPFGTIEAALEASNAWLKSKEKERLT